MSAFYTSHLGAIQQSFDYALLAISVQIALRCGLFSLASVGFWSLGAYAAGIMSLHGANGVTILVIVALGAFIAGYIFALPLARLRGLYLAMATVAFDLVIPILAVAIGGWTGGGVGLYGIPPRVDTLGLVLCAVIVIVIVALTERSWMGRSQIALREDEQVAISMGVSIRRERALAFALSAAIGALAGALNALLFYSVSPDSAGFGLVTLALTMAIIGGRDSWVGAVIGAFLLTWLPNVLAFVGTWRNLIYGAVLVVIVLYAPNGIYGAIASGVRRVRQIGVKTIAPAKAM